MSWNLVDEIEGAARDLGASFDRLPDSEVTSLVSVIRQRWCGGRSGLPPWERFENATSVQSETAWRAFADLRFEPILLLDPRDVLAGWRFRSGGDLVRLLEATHGFELYVTDSECAFVSCFNHHDVLVGVGTASAWVEALAARHRGSHSS